MTAFTNMVDTLESSPLIHISQSQFEEFDRQYIIDALRGVAYGRAFCEYFEIPRKGNAIIYHMRSPDIAREWIKDNYLL